MLLSLAGVAIVAVLFSAASRSNNPAAVSMPSGQTEADNGTPTLAFGREGSAVKTTFADRVAAALDAAPPPPGERVVGLVAVTPTPLATLDAVTGYLINQHGEFNQQPLYTPADLDRLVTTRPTTRSADEPAMPAFTPGSLHVRTPADGDGHGVDLTFPRRRPSWAMPEPVRRLVTVNGLSPGQVADLTKIFAAAASVHTVVLPPRAGERPTSTDPAVDTRWVTLVVELRPSTPSTRP